MNSAQLISSLSRLEEELDDLEEDFEPLLNEALAATTKKLPLLEKAKLYTLIVYSIESLLFSYLRINGVDAKEHPVFKELTRVKQYFDKIKQAEAGPPTPRENMSLNKEAAGRILKAHLAANTKIDLELREKQAREALLAKRKLRALEQKMSEAVPAEVLQPPPEPKELSEGEIDEDEKPAAPDTSVPNEQIMEVEVEAEGKSPSLKRRKSGGKKSRQSPKSRKQKRKHSNPFSTG